MELKDLFSKSMLKLKQVSFLNDYLNDKPEGTINFKLEDSLSDFYRDDENHNKTFVNYKRKIYSTNTNSICLEVTFQFCSIIKEGINPSDQEIKDLINQNKRKFVLFAPAEASVIISNIMQSAGFPPIVTQPTYLENSPKGGKE